MKKIQPAALAFDELLGLMSTGAEFAIMRYINTCHHAACSQMMARYALMSHIARTTPAPHANDVASALRLFAAGLEEPDPAKRRDIEQKRLMVEKRIAQRDTLMMSGQAGNA